MVMKKYYVLDLHIVWILIFSIRISRWGVWEGQITSEIRRHMEDLGYLEIETPVLQVLLNGCRIL